MPIGPAEGNARTAPGRNVPLVVLVVLGVLAAVAIGVAAYLGFQARNDAAYQESLDQAPAAAERAAVAVLSYDHESLDADRDAAAKFLSSGYQKDYLKTYELVQQNAPELKAQVEAEVLASSAMVGSGDRDPDRVPVLLFVNQTTVSSATEGRPSVALNRVRFDMVKVDGSWLVDDITSY
jgi:Mce-associated membrane protein